MVIVPVRGVRSGFAATLKVTVPSPVPSAGDVIEIQDAADAAVQPQPASVSTLTPPLVAFAGTEALTGATENVQVCPDCVTLSVWPPTVIVPLRDDVPGLAPTLYVT
jgi:hypothetical protein